ncbi:AmmeMemoRadiSam system protein B [Candidatus Nitronereus thalassa]|uniref:AmmeMemoRadiSam system protein B n=1 Tax=Candidatus Nitronereus thalassa TaxID=3020898 RepID=A0ABU3K6V7_9BACT|nr:AmmeMemoRadiSam system protein B [Candidatus Nitronereus thalassa]MDT7042068.1 AmmeMemoRadiSam system protein B [Candidatus Nitronereus thalassa]
MAEPVKDPKMYPALRNIQYSPMKQGEEQYIVLWDPSGLSSEKLIIPLNLFFLFQFLDGEHSLEQVGVEYLKKYGDFLMPDKLDQLIADLDQKLFLEGERYEAAKAAALKAYREAPTRTPQFAGKSYEEDPEKLREQIAEFFASKEGPGSKPSENQGKLIKGLVAPNFELKKAGPLYAWAYKELKEAESPDVFVVIGIGHAGLDEPVAVTDKAFETPLGVVPVNRPILDHLKSKGGPELFAEEIRHQQEQSIEFQLPFLQETVGKEKSISIVPILSSFPPITFLDPELKDFVAKINQFVSLLKEAIVSSGQNVCIIASANLAHIGLRYGDNTAPTDFSFHRCMQTDLEMLKHVENIDAQSFAQFLITEQDKRHVLGFSAIYLLLKLIEAEKGEVLRYDREIVDQFNSTITYASAAFF